ncbi:putative hydrolase [Rosa chinensis]|uniref:Putative hydrolase n=1 Tax=Rosa chinensis TaxID=74649 RepID=A0A2P6QFC7_ROSCH|nr:putative hydrolase [Rosa chinensis]
MSVSVNSSDQVCENGTAELLPATNDDHGGVIVDMKDAMEPQAFRALLRASIVQWRLQGKKGVWIKLPIELVNLVEMVVKEGFHYHHAEPHYLMLVYWIPETTNTIPANASHRVGVGAIILNDKNEGEDITVAAVREVKEETGWISLEEFAAQPVTQKHGLFKCIHELCLAKVKGNYAGFFHCL